MGKVPFSQMARRGLLVDPPFFRRALFFRPKNADPLWSPIMLF
jgi:hypothetical protein